MANTILTLKVFFESTEITRSFRFPGEESIDNIVREIKEKTGEGGKDFGLFLPPNPAYKQQGQWLERNRALRFYNIKNDARVEYKKKHRPLSVRTADDAERKVLIDDSATVRTIADAVGEKLGLGKHTIQFSLAHPGGTAKEIRWLREDRTLHEEDVLPGSTLEFLKRYSVRDQEGLGEKDAYILHLLYTTTVKQVVGQVYFLTKNDAKDFATLQLQVVYGDHDPVKHKPGFADLSAFLPPEFLQMSDKEEQKRFISEIYRDHKKVKGLRDVDAKKRYIQLARSLKTYGYALWDCQLQHEAIVEKKTKKIFGGKDHTITKLSPVILGIAFEGFCLIDPETHQFLKNFTFRALKSWSAVGDVLQLVFTGDKSYVFVTTAAEAIVSQIAGCISIHLRLQKDPEKIVSHSSGEVAELEDGDEEWGDESNLTIMSSYINPNQLAAGQGTFFLGGTGAMPKNMGHDFTMDPSMVNASSMPHAMRAARMLASDLATGSGAWGKKGALTEEGWLAQLNASKTTLNNDLNDFLGILAQAGAQPDRIRLDAKAGQISLGLRNIAAAARNLSVLNEVKHAPLLDGAKALCDSLADLMSLIVNTQMDGSTNGPTINDIIIATKKQFAAAMMLLGTAPDCYVDDGSKLLLSECISDLDLKLMRATQLLQEEAHLWTPENKLLLESECRKIEAIKGVAFATMAALIPHLGDPQALIHIHHAKTTVQDLLSGLQTKYQQALTAQSLTAAPGTESALDDVQVAIKNLFEASKSKEARSVQGNIDVISPSVLLLTHLAGLRAALRVRTYPPLYRNVTMPGDPFSMNHATNAIESQSAVLIELVSSLANQLPDLKTALETSIAELEADSKALIAESKLLQANTDDHVSGTRAKALVGVLERSVQSLISNVGQTTAIHNLRFHAKNVASSMIRLGTSALTLAPLTTDPDCSTLMGVSKELAVGLTSMLNLLQIACGNPDNIIAQQALQEGVLKQVPALQGFIQSAVSTIPKLATHPTHQQALATTGNQAFGTLTELIKSCARLDSMHGNVLIAEALGSLDLIQAELETAACFSEQGALAPIYQFTLAQLLEKITPNILRLKQQNSALAEASRRGDRDAWPDHVTETTLFVGKVSDLAGLIARALPADRITQGVVLDAALKVVNDTRDLIAATRVLCTEPSPPKAALVEDCLTALTRHLDTMVSNALGFHPASVDQAIQMIRAAKEALHAPPEQEHLPEQPLDIGDAAKGIAVPLHSFAQTARQTPSQIAYEAKLTAGVIGQLIRGAHVIAFDNETEKEAILTAAGRLADVSLPLLQLSHDVAAQSPDALEAIDKQSANIEAAVAALCECIRSAPNTKADQAIKRIMDRLQAPPEHLEVALARHQLLGELDQQVSNIEDAIETLIGLPKADKPHVPNYRDFSNALADSVEALLSAGALCVAANGKKPMLSANALRLHHGAQLLLEHQSDAQVVQHILGVIAADADTLLSEAKTKIEGTPSKQARQAILESTQELAVCLDKCLQGLQNPSQLHESDILKLKSRLGLQYALIHNTRKNPDLAIPSATGKQIASATEAIAIQATLVLKTTALLTPFSEMDDPKRKQLADDIEALKKGIKSLTDTRSTLDRSKEEMRKASKLLEKAIADLDSAFLFASIGALEVTGADKTRIQEAQAIAKQSVRATGTHVKALVNAIKTASTEDLLAVAGELQKTIPVLADQITLVAASMDDLPKTLGVLASAKQLGTALFQLTTSALHCDKKAPQTLTTFAMHAAKSTGELTKLNGLLNTGATTLTELENILDSLKQALNELPTPLDKGDFKTCHEHLLSSARKIGTEMAALLNAETHADILSAAKNLGETVPTLLAYVRGAASTSEGPAIKDQFAINATNLTEGVIEAITKAKGIMVGTGEKPEQLTAFNNTNKAIAALLASAKAGQAEIVLFNDSADRILAVLTGLALLKIDSQQGVPLQADPRLLPELNEDITKAFQTLGLACLGLANQDISDADLAIAAKNLANALDDLTKLCHFVLPKFSDPNDASKYLNEFLNTSVAASRLLLATKMASKDSTASPLLAKASKIAEQAQTNVLAVLSEALQESSTTGTQLKSHAALLDQFEKPPPKTDATPNDLKAAARDLMEAVGDLIVAPTDSEALLLSESVPRLMSTLYATALGIPQTFDNEDLYKDLHENAEHTLQALRALMAVNATLPSRTKLQQEQNEASFVDTHNQLTKALAGLINVSKQAHHKPKAEMAGTLTEVTEVADDDIEAFAENELLKCAQMIKDAAALIMATGPKKRTNLSVGLDTQDINEAILEAARAIAAATGSLIECAAVSQAERKEESKSGSSKYHADPSWANGLISAAQTVAENVKSLVESANSNASGQPDEERLIACARAVATTTIHLVTASRIKGDPNSTSQRNLSKASTNVTLATQQLVVAANAVSELADEDEEDFSRINFAAASGIRAQMEQRGKIEKLEKELREKRQELLTLRRSRYQKHK